VEDALRAVGQAYARLGTPDPRKDSHGGTDFRIQRQIKVYKKGGDPPRRVKPIPILVIIFILAQVYGAARNAYEVTIADMITIAFFFLLRPGEFTGTTADDAHFRLQDVALFIGVCRIDVMIASLPELDSATSVSYTFTAQKNGTEGEKVVQGLSGNALCFPVKAIIRRINYHRMRKSKSNVPIASYYRVNRWVAIKAKDSTDVIRLAMTINFHCTGIAAAEVSARSLRAGGDMALMYGHIDMNNIRMMVRWHSDTMMRYLHIQETPILNKYADAMFNDGNYSFLPDETVPIVDVYDD
jgi:hypothetical protein